MKLKSITTALTILFCVSTFSLIGCDGNGGDSNPVSSNGMHDQPNNTNDQPDGTNDQPSDTDDQPASTLSSTPAISNFVINGARSTRAFAPFTDAITYNGTYDFTDAEGDITSAIIRVEGPWGAVTEITTFGDLLPVRGTTSGTVSFSNDLQTQVTIFGMLTVRLTLRDSQGNISDEAITTFVAP